jgi:hypothetical protein
MCGQVSKSDSGRPIATTGPLMGPLPAVMSRTCLCHLTHLIQGPGTLSLQAFLIEGPVIPFDKPMLLGVIGITEHHRDSQGVTKTDQSSRKVTPEGMLLREPRVPIQCDGGR